MRLAGKLAAALAFLAAGAGGVEIHSYNLFHNGQRLNQPVATSALNAVDKFAASEEMEIAYLRLRWDSGSGQTLADIFRANHDASGCSPTCRRISRPPAGANETVTVSISRDGGRVAYLWGTTFAGDWKIDLVDSDGTDLRAVPLGVMVAARVPVPVFSCDGLWLKFSAGPNGSPMTEWYVSTGAVGAPIPIVNGDWPGAAGCPWIFRDGFETGDSSRWVNGSL